jgi:DNA modification methylase
MEPYKLALLDINAVKPNPQNARTHNKRQLKQIATSIKAFGFTNPVLIDERDILIAGHGRLEAAKTLGVAQIPAIRITHLSALEKRALMLADNKIALNAGWNNELLASELADLSTLELSFDVQLTGFEIGEIDLIIGDADNGDTHEAETAPEPDPNAPILTQPGDLWILGDHKVLCGDARNPKELETLMGDEQADVGFTDPPYNVKINGHVSGAGKVQHREFVEASGEMTSEEFTSFLTDALKLAAKHSRSGAVWFACMDWRHMGEVLGAGEAAFDAFLNMCVWTKTNGGMGSLYRSQHELVFVFRKGGTTHRNNVQLGRFGRNRTNVWKYAGVNTFREGRMEELIAHPTAKPVAMIKDALLDVSKRGDIVLDPFLGGGATLIAAQRSGRQARGLEIDPAYVDVILRRWRTETGQEPARQRDGCTLKQLEVANMAEALS